MKVKKPVSQNENKLVMRDVRKSTKKVRKHPKNGLENIHVVNYENPFRLSILKKCLTIKTESIKFIDTLTEKLLELKNLKNNPTSGLAEYEFLMNKVLSEIETFLKKALIF